MQKSNRMKKLLFPFLIEGSKCRSLGKEGWKSSTISLGNEYFFEITEQNVVPHTSRLGTLMAGIGIGKYKVCLLASTFRESSTAQCKCTADVAKLLYR